MNPVSKIFKVKYPAVYPSDETPVACSNPDLICGVELETENARPNLDWYVDNLSHAWMVDRDGSLRGRDTAYEFISKPLAMGLLIPELTKFFGTTGFGEKNYSDRCSVHVHTNVTDFTQDGLASLVMIYTVLESILFQYVNHHNAPTTEGYSRDTNIYCVPWNQCRFNKRLVEKLFNRPTAPVAAWQKYTALNLLPIAVQGTVEWRHMHGTADMEKLTVWLNIIGNIMLYARKTPLDDIIKTIKHLNDTSAYKKFFTDVLKESLPYSEEYRASLIEGVVNAKYSLFDWDRSKIPAKMEIDPLAETLQVLRNRQVVQRNNTRDRLVPAFNFQAPRVFNVLNTPVAIDEPVAPIMGHDDRVFLDEFPNVGIAERQV